jgi:hypothetical protein
VEALGALAAGLENNLRDDLLATWAHLLAVFLNGDDSSVDVDLRQCVVGFAGLEHWESVAPLFDPLSTDWNLNLISVWKHFVSVDQLLKANLAEAAAAVASSQWEELHAVLNPQPADLNAATIEPRVIQHWGHCFGECCQFDQGVFCFHFHVIDLFVFLISCMKSIVSDGVGQILSKGSLK